MRSVPKLVAIAALLVLAVVALARFGGTPSASALEPHAVGPPDNPGTRVEIAADLSSVGVDERGDVAARGRETVPTGSAATAVRTGRLSGRVLDKETRAPIADAFVAIGLRSDYPGTRDVARPRTETQARSTTTDTDGDFTFTKLEPGSYSLSVEIGRRPPFNRWVQIDERGERVEALIESGYSLPVVLLGPGGDRLEGSVGKERDLTFRIVESSNDPGTRWSDQEGRSLAVLGRGILEGWGSGSYAGEVRLQEPLPRWVSACVRREVVASKLVVEGDERVELTIPERCFVSTSSTVRMSIVDSITGEPLAGARVGIRPIGEFGSGQIETSTEGTAEIENVRTGPMCLTIVASGHEWVQEQVTIVPGETDLGAWRLAPATRISGTVLDGGAPVADVTLRAYPLERFDAVRAAQPPVAFGSKKDGRFAVGPIGRGRYLLRVDDPERVSDAIVVDTNRGDVEDLVVHVSRGFEVRFRFDEQVGDATLRLHDGLGLPVREVDLEGEPEITVRLAPGRYSCAIVASGAEREPHGFDVPAHDVEVRIRR